MRERERARERKRETHRQNSEREIGLEFGGRGANPRVVTLRSSGGQFGSVHRRGRTHSIHF